MDALCGRRLSVVRRAVANRSIAAGLDEQKLAQSERWLRAAFDRPQQLDTRVKTEVATR